MAASNVLFSLVNLETNEKPLVLERNTPPIICEPLFQAVGFFGLLSALENRAEWCFTND
jgi:hypothetical protein